MSIGSALLLNRNSIPSLEAISEHIRVLGHEFVFTRAFSMNIQDDGLWRTVNVDGEETGFDFVYSERTSWADNDPEVTVPPESAGDSILDFGARGFESLRAVALVQHAICTIASAHGWIEDEVISPGDMIAVSEEVINGTLEKQLAEVNTPEWDAELAAAVKEHAVANPMPYDPIGRRKRNFTQRLVWVALFVVAILIGWNAAFMTG